jgi:hypothetical protein
MTTLSQFLKENATEIKAFEPTPLYTPEGDSLMFYIKDEESYRERIDELLTVYRSIETNEIIGCQIKGVRHKLAELSKFFVTVTSKELELGLLFLTYMAMASRDETVRHSYEFLGEHAKRLGARLRPDEILQSARCKDRATDQSALAGK